MQVESGMIHVCDRTVQNILHKGGYKYQKSRKQRLLKKSDLQKRIKFCRKVKKHKLTQEFWNKQMSLYIDCEGFQYKQNPRDQARRLNQGNGEKNQKDYPTLVLPRGRKRDP